MNRKLREKMQKEHEDQIKLQDEIEIHIREENIRKQELKEISERQILSTYLKTSDIGADLYREDHSFNNNDLSNLSADKSNTDEYSSFINDIRTVYELQDEESNLQFI